MVNKVHHDEDPTGGGSYLPSLPKLYQNIFKQLGINGPPTQADPSTIVPPQGMQDFYNSAFKTMGFPPSPRNPNRIQRYPDHPGHAQTGYGSDTIIPNGDYAGWSAPEAIKDSQRPAPSPRPSMPNRPDEGGSPDYIPYYPPHQSVPPAYTPPGADVPIPSFMRNRTGTQDQYTTDDFPDRPRPSTLRTNATPRSDFYSLNTGPYNDRPTYVGDNTTSVSHMTPSTGRAHLTAPVMPSSDERQNTSQPAPVRAQPKPPLHDTGSNQQTQQAIYYTRPDTGNNGGGGRMERLGVGVDTSKLDPNYISYVDEPVNMTSGQRLMRGAFDQPDNQDGNQMASGGVIDSAHKIAREKATPCHVGLINMAVGGRTDHLPMHVREGSYVLPADIVSALGEGNTMAGSKVVDHMFAGHPAHKAGGGATISVSKKPQFLQSTRTLPGDVELGVDGQDTAGTALMGNMFSGGPFGTANKAPQFQSVTKPSLSEYDQMKRMFSQPAPSLQNASKAANGGPIMSGNRRPVPIIAAGGEYVIDPDDVAHYGGGDIDKGHDMLDDFVKHVRKHLVKTLSKLPGPRRD